MAVLATVVVVAITFLHSQTSSIRAAENGRAADLATHAAETGIAAALDAMQNPSWQGVSVPLTAEVSRNEQGFAIYTVTFSKVSGDGTATGATAAALQVRLRSTGAWQAFGASRATERKVEAVVSLTPRLAGRPSRPGDVPSANDRASDVAGFSQAQNYALFAAEGSNSFSSRPQTRVSGDVWIGEQLSLFEDLLWSSTARQALLTGLGTDNGGGTGATSPHPLAGSMTFYVLPSAAQQADLISRLKVPYSTTSTRLTAPAFDASRFRKYRLFAGGFEYNAAELGSTLQASQNETLRPSESNPLGIFFCNGSLAVQNNVVVRGTLVAMSGITFEGRGISITPFDWRDGSGGTPVLDQNLWPVLPAVVAGGHVTFNAASQSFIGGTVLSAQDVVANTPDYVSESALLNYDGTATATPQGDGLSKVQVTDLLTLLSGLTINESHAVQFQSSGRWGEWYPVVTANTLTGAFQVRGTVEFSSPTTCRFRPRRVHHADIMGPLISRRALFANPPAWSAVSSSSWTAKYNAWQDKRNGILGLLLARPNLTFSQSLAEDGFPFEPTVRIARPQNVNYACEPPLFQPDPSSRSAGGGYRWEVVSWREVSS
ncbi:MAG: hypothetical protein M3552_07160 [Planctomycetota bacterium]|nr:hypothetical protein [Planctomycetota bacterium]